MHGSPRLFAQTTPWIATIYHLELQTGM